MATAAAVAHAFWEVGGFSIASLDALIPYIWSTLPVLAITNAMPMLGAGAVLARYAVAEKPGETLKQIEDALDDDRQRFQEEKRGMFVGLRRFRSALREAPAELIFYKDKQPLFTNRPNWDGAWYWYAAQGDLTPAVQAAHELTICSVQVVHHVRRLRKSGVWLVGRGKRSTQGSLWFLDRLSKAGAPTISASMARQQASEWVELAAASLHYMREELEAHRTVIDTDEQRDTEFVDIFCEYMKWLGYFHAKTLSSRWAGLLERYPAASELTVPPSIADALEKISATKNALWHISAANLPRRHTAERIRQVRRGVLLPITGTAAATLLCFALTPLSGYSPQTALTVADIAYDTIAASLVGNFAFGLWLLLPSRGRVRG